MDKLIKFPKITEIIECEADLGIPDCPGVVFEFWKNPSKPTVTTLFEVIMASANELGSMSKLKMDDLERRYYSAVCEIIVDCNLESLDFSTPERAMASFEAPDIPIGFVHQVIASYLRRLLEFNDSVKKALALFLLGSASGKDSATPKEEK
jgi:hypothetical protein